jgi:hypothetical protein
VCWLDPPVLEVILRGVLEPAIRQMVATSYSEGVVRVRAGGEDYSVRSNSGDCTNNQYECFDLMKWLRTHECPKQVTLVAEKLTEDQFGDFDIKLYEPPLLNKTSWSALCKTRGWDPKAGANAMKRTRGVKRDNQKAKKASTGR